MDVPLILLVFGVVLVAELPDKTMFATLMLGARFAARWVFLGAAAAFAVHVVIAVSAGSLLGLLPGRVLDVIVGALFLLGSALLWRASRADEDDADAAAGRVGTSAGAVLAASFSVIFIGEWGDITQIATANLAATHQDVLSVGIGAILGLWTAAALAITAGSGLLRLVRPVVLHRAGAVLFLALGLYSLARAAR
ncbi:MAG: TMEM165/GDT1 family protein [Sporichthyaceae bacterium]